MPAPSLNTQQFLRSHWAEYQQLKEEPTAYSRRLLWPPQGRDQHSQAHGYRTPDEILRQEQEIPERAVAFFRRKPTRWGAHLLTLTVDNPTWT